MTRLHISENCKQLKIMSITTNICIDNALFYLFHITPEQSWSHMETVFYKYSTFYINPNSKILPIKSFIFVNLKFHYCLGREKSSSLQQQKRGGEKKKEVWKSLSRIKCRFLFNFLKKQCLYLRNIINMWTMADESHHGPHQ